MASVLNVNTITSTASNPIAVSNWAKGLTTFPVRDEKVKASFFNVYRQGPRGRQAANIFAAQVLKRRPVHRQVLKRSKGNIYDLDNAAAEKVTRFRISSEMRNDGIYLNRALDEYRMNIRSNTKFNIGSVSTTLDINSPPQVQLDFFFLSSFQEKKNQNQISDYLEASRKAALLNQPWLSHRIETLQKNLSAPDDSTECLYNVVTERLQIESDESRVISALENPLWDFRTITGIAKETELSSEFVERTLKKYPQKIRRSKVPNRNGEVLFTLSSRPEKLQEKLALWSIFIKKSI